MASQNWRRLGDEHKPTHIDRLEDDCYFLLDYTPGGGYQASEDNQLVLNLKTNPKAAKSPRHRHRIRLSVKGFAEALHRPIDYYRRLFSRISLVPIPNSKSKTDPDHHDNLEIIGQILQSKFGQRIKLENPIANKFTRRKASKTFGVRDRQYIERLKANFHWLGLSNQPELIIIYDDVITSGAQFRAVKEFISANLEHQPKPRMIGFFWARTTRQPTLGPIR